MPVGMPEVQRVSRCRQPRPGHSGFLPLVPYLGQGGKPAASCGAGPCRAGCRDSRWEMKPSSLPPAVAPEGPGSVAAARLFCGKYEYF